VNEAIANFALIARPLPPHKIIRNRRTMMRGKSIHSASLRDNTR